MSYHRLSADGLSCEFKMLEDLPNSEERVLPNSRSFSTLAVPRSVCIHENLDVPTRCPQILGVRPLFPIRKRTRLWAMYEVSRIDYLNQKAVLIQMLNRREYICSHALRIFLRTGSGKLISNTPHFISPLGADKHQLEQSLLRQIIM